MSRDSIDELAICPGLVDEIVRHCAAALPNEGCGLLSGRREGAALVGARLFPGTNALASPSRFAMAPDEVIAALDAIERAGERLVAIVHSHPATPATPSRTDLDEAYYPDALLLIVSLAGPTPSIRAWRVERSGDAGAAVEVAVRPPAGGQRRPPLRDPGLNPTKTG